MISATSETPALLEQVDAYRAEANRRLDPQRRSALGQFMTPLPVARFMASLCGDWNSEEVRLLDAGAGVGSLTAAFVAEICQRPVHPVSVVSTAYELETLLADYLDATLELCQQACTEHAISFTYNVVREDFIQTGSERLINDLFSESGEKPLFTHAILNPPYSCYYSRWAGDSTHPQ